MSKKVQESKIGHFTHSNLSRVQLYCYRTNSKFVVSYHFFFKFWMWGRGTKIRRCDWKSWYTNFRLVRQYVIHYKWLWRISILFKIVCIVFVIVPTTVAVAVYFFSSPSFSLSPSLWLQLISTLVVVREQREETKSKKKN